MQSRISVLELNVTFSVQPFCYILKILAGLSAGIRSVLPSVANLRLRLTSSRKSGGVGAQPTTLPVLVDPNFIM